MNASTLPLWIGGLAVAGGLLAGTAWYATRPALPTASVQAAVAPLPDPASAPEPNVEPAAQPIPEPAPEPRIAPLRLDEVRLDADGSAVIAGRATPFADVILRADGAEIARASANGRGAFATFAMLEPSPDPRILTLAELDGQGGERLSEDELILAPIRAPESKPEPTPEPTPEPQVAALAPETETEPVSPAAPDPTAPAAQTAPEPPLETAALTLTPDPVDPAPSVVPEPEPTPDIQTAQTAQTAQTPDPPTTPEPDPPQQVAILRSGPEGVDVVQPAARAPQILTEVALDAISYSATGDVQLSGRAQSDTREVRVYLDNRPVAALTVDAAGDWRGDVPDIDSGIYTLRLDEVAADGRVTSRIETPFKRESPETLAAVVEPDTAPVRVITVQAGATLWAIARERYGDPLLYVQVFEANRAAIRDPDLIYPGQIFTLPDPE